MKCDPNIEKGIFIAINCAAALKAQRQIAHGNDNHPCACKTKFG